MIKKIKIKEINEKNGFLLLTNKSYKKEMA